MFDAITQDVPKEARPVSGLGTEALAVPFGPGGAGLVVVYDQGSCSIWLARKPLD